jgi:hypothetical protein
MNASIIVGNMLILDGAIDWSLLWSSEGLNR